LCLKLHEAKFDCWVDKERFNTLLASRDNCHNCQKSLTIELKV